MFPILADLFACISSIGVFEVDQFSLEHQRTTKHSRALTYHSSLKDLRQVFETCHMNRLVESSTSLTENIFTSFGERHDRVQFDFSKVSFLATKVTDLGFHPIARIVFRN